MKSKKGKQITPFEFYFFATQLAATRGILPPMKFTFPQNPIGRFFLDIIFIFLVFSLIRVFVAYFTEESISAFQDSLIQNWKFDVGFIVFLAGLRAFKRRQNLPSNPPK